MDGDGSWNEERDGLGLVAGSAGAGQTSVCPAGWIASGRVSGKMSAGLARVKLFGEFRKAEQPQPHQPKRGKTLVPTYLHNDLN